VAKAASTTGIGAHYEMPQALCGWNPVCMPFQLPPNWQAGTSSSGAQGAYNPPYTSVSALGGGTLDKISFTAVVNGQSISFGMGGAGGGLMTPSLYQCPAGATIVGFGWATEASSNWQYGAFAGLHS
jgi:hypothetical protein